MKRLDLPLLLSLSLPIFLIAFRNVIWTQCWPASDFWSWFFCQESTLLFLVWNLFLASLPFGFAYLLKSKQPAWVNICYFAIWMLFLPNAPYLVSDLVHLRPRPGAPFVLDLVLFLSFVWAGLYVGVRSLLLMQARLAAFCSSRLTNLLIGGAIFLSGVGVYIGRYLRWNSWDIFTQPHRIVWDSLLVFTEFRSLSIALAYSGILALVYLSFFLRGVQTSSQAIHSG